MFQNLGIAQHHYGLIGKFRTPIFEIVTDGFISVKAVNMQEIDAAILKLIYCIVKSRAYELSARALFCHEIDQVLIDWFTLVLACVPISAPSVDIYTARFGIKSPDGITRSEEACAIQDAEFHEFLRTEFFQCNWPDWRRRGGRFAWTSKAVSDSRIG